MGGQRLTKHFINAGLRQITNSELVELVYWDVMVLQWYIAHRYYHFIEQNYSSHVGGISKEGTER